MLDHPIDSQAFRVLETPEGDMGVAVEGVDPEQMTSAIAESLKTLIYKHKFIVLRDLDMNTLEYIAFAKHFGRIEPYHQSNYHHPDHPEIFVSSNVQMDGKKVGVSATGQFWHTDYSFMPEPLSFTFVYPQIIPEGKRGTMFVDMARVLGELPDDLKALCVDRRAFHDATHYYKVRPEDIDKPIIDLVRKFRAMSPGQWHPLILKHPVTGEESLYMSGGFTTAIEGLSVRENHAVIARLAAFSQQEKFIRLHQLKKGELMMWDNRALIHHASHPVKGGESCNYRISLYDGLPFYTNPIDRELPTDVYNGEYLATC